MTPKGFAYLSLATTTYGILHVIDKASLQAGVDPTAYTVSRVFVAALMMVATAYVTQTNPIRNVFRAGSLKDLFTIGILASGWGLLLQIRGLSSTSAINAGLLLTLTAPVTALFAAIVLKEEVSSGIIAAILLMIGGVCCLYGLDQATSFGIGDAMILVAVVGYGYSNVLVRKTMKNVPATTVTLGRLFFGSLSIAILLPLFATPLSSVMLSPKWVLLGGTVFGIRMAAYHKGIQLEGAAVAAAFLLFCPVVTAFTANIILGEPLSNGTFVGTGLSIIGGCLLVASSVAKTRKAAASL